jgi:hypothetical protein
MTQGTPVRDYFTDDAKGLAHWVGRKLNNHDPMRTRINAKLSQRGGEKIAFVGGTDQKSVMYTLPDGRQFVFTVEEITTERREQFVAAGTEKFVHA